MCLPPVTNASKNGTEPIAADEILYRRVPASPGWYDEGTGLLKPQAFDPHRKNDLTGISVSRAQYKTIEEAARGQPGKSYYVAVLRAGDLLAKGIRVLPRPLPNDPGHAEFPDLNATNRKSNRVLELQRILAELTIEVEGPFVPPDM